MVTIKEIAKRAGVSVGTVDRVIHNRGRVSKVTARRVRQIIKELDYKPNILARSLSRLKTFQFGVLMPEISPDNHYWELAIQGIEKAQQELKIHKINVTYYCYDGYSEASFINASKWLPLLRIMDRFSFCSGESSGSRFITCAIPKTAFRGVRSSWLMVDMNLLFA